MKIQRIESFCTRDVGFVRVTTDDGAFGWGQVSTYHADISALVLHRQVAPWVLGQDALDIDALVDYMARFKGPNAPYAPGTRPEDGGTPRIQREGGSVCPTNLS